jgi:uncharacterized protein with NRDE domain
MCLIVFAIHPNPEVSLVLASNRDEFFNRKTEPAQVWNTIPKIWAGKDLENGGTWLGITESGRFAFLTNYRNLYLPKVESPISRGLLVKEFLLTGEDPQSFIRNRRNSGNDYEGFNLVVGDLQESVYWNNKKDLIKVLSPGMYGLSNGLLDEPWPKLTKAKSSFSKVFARDQREILGSNGPGHSGRQNLSDIYHDSDLVGSVFGFLQDTSLAPDDSLPDTGLDYSREKAISSIFIQVPGYGTRSSTYVALDASGRPIHREERVYVP